MRCGLVDCIDYKPRRDEEWMDDPALHDILPDYGDDDEPTEEYNTARREIEEEMYRRTSEEWLKVHKRYKQLHRDINKQLIREIIH